NIYSTTATKDLRITAIDLLLIVDMNYAIEVAFSPISYKVSVESSPSGTVTITNAVVGYNGVSTVTAKPKTGYYIYGYTINGGPVIVARLPELTSACPIRFILDDENDNRIREDKHIVIVYRRIQIAISVKNTTTAYNVYLDGSLLNSSIDKIIDYKQSASYQISLDNGNYRISSIVITTKTKDGDVVNHVTTHYNMTSYKLTFNDVTQPVIVEIACAPKTNDVSPEENTYFLQSEATNIENITYSVKNKIASIAEENEIIVIANAGYEIKKITLSGNKGNTLTQDLDNLEWVKLAIPAGAFAQDEIVDIRVVSQIKQYDITTIVVGGDDFDFEKRQPYGASVGINIREVANHYIAKFMVNGEEISFDANNWVEKRRNENTKEYISGTYLLVITQDTTIYLEYELNYYNVTLDSNSINGVTEFYSGGSPVTSGKLKHGENLIINMSAVEGYHIKSLYINNVLVQDLNLPSSIANNNTRASYTYQGVNSSLTVKVVYEINRYSFTYEIENISKNFASYELEPGSLTTESNILKASDFMFTGIEYGRNFYINAIPATLNGYYLVSISIRYDGRDLTIPAGENRLISSRGGMIYFNTMLDFNEGIRQDVELIKLTFDKLNYDISLQQESLEHTGSLALSYEHPNSASNIITLFGDDGKLYYYYPQDSSVKDSQFNDLDWIYNSQTGKYNYVDINGDVRHLKVEHGIRYIVNATPTLGYRRTHFMLNGNDVNNMLSNNTYKLNIARNTDISVNFAILTYTVNFTARVADKNLTGRIPDSAISNYATISIVDFTNPSAPITYPLLANVSTISMVFNYGTKIKLVMTPKFATTGYYLDNMYFIDREIREFEDDTKGTVTYGGADGISLTSDINAIANFHITTYKITTVIDYIEPITGESANTLINEGHSTIAWGDTATIKVASGSGYELGEIYVTRDGQPIFVTLTPTEEQLATDLEKYVKNDYSIIHGLRDVIVVRKVESDIVVTARFIRKNYTVNFNFTNANFLDYIEVALNQYNPIYPTKNPVAGYWSSSSTYQIDARHYDELAGTIAPKNGYEIMEMVLTLKAVYWDQSTLSYKPLKDYGGNDIIYYLPFTTVSGDILSFTFHEPTKLIADLSLESDLMIDLTVRIKTYTVDTAINRDSSDSKAPNDTAVTMSVRTEAGQNVRVNNVAQVAQTLTTTNKGKIYIAEHHGTIIYDFDAPEGYMLSNIFVNGINWTESMLKASSYSDEYLDITASKIGAAYRYKIVMKVKDPLIEGHNHIVYNDMSDLTVVITIKLITYEIKSIINGVEYESVIIDNRNTFTDNQTIKVVSANTTNHYNNFNISPEIFQGYQVIGMNMSIYTNGVLTDIGYAFNIEQTNTILINHVNLKYVNVLEDNLVLYICYTTEIKRYNVDIFAYAYSIDIWQDTTEGRVNNNSTAGVLTVSALTNGVRTEDITTAYRHEYFTIITGVAYAKTDYILYSIQEYIGPNRPEDWLTSSNWVDVKDGVRGIDYSYVTEPNGTVKYTFEYQVDDYGDRTFRAVFRQQTTVTVNVINPYRFSGTMSGSAAVGNMNYIYYPEIVARIGGAVVPNIYDNGINNVVDTYIYKVNVGSVMTMQFFDNGASANDIFGIYYIQNDKYVENTEIKTGFEIRAKWDFYLIAKTKLYITYQKEVNAASTAATGGAILFALDNGDLVSNESSPIPVYNEATVTQTVTIVVQPYQNYIFTGLRVRQIDQEASRMAGRIIYAQGASEWLTYNASNFDSLDTNGFIISESINPAGHTTYTITMTGNMELSFVFYKTYNISYTARYSDIGDFDDITLKDNKINNNLLESNTEVSYNSSFTLIAPMADTTLYQFMGWYVNGVNIYRFLSTRYPDINRYTNLFEINGSSMTLEYNNVELDDIEIVALYQRIINVSLINELYYYDTQTMHWNSWTTGAIRTQYYNYVPTQGLPLIKTIENVNNRAALTIESILGPTNASYNAINAMIGGTPAGTDATWNTLAQVPLSFDRSESQAYSSATFFKVLYQNVTNQEYIADTWKTSDIELILTGLPNTVRLQAWQYYDWTSGIYKDIGYSYKDPSGLLDSLGNEIIIDCTNTEYLFNLGYIYSGNMPGAISNASGDARPLIIRPFFRKVVSIELNKLTYIDKLGGNSETEFTPQVGPSINGLTIEFPQTNNFYNLGSPFQYIADDNRSAEFDYGAKIEIRSYRTIDDNGYPVYNTAEENYRFVGWFLNWEVNGSTRYRYIIDMDGDVNRAGENYTIYMTYNFGEEPPEDDTLQYRAVYINQYAHNIYSYNIAGGNNYQDALNNGTYAYKDAPAIDRNSLRINTEAVPFATFDVSKTGINRAGMTELYYSFEIISDESQTHKLEFYIDIGCVYTFDMDMSYINRVANYLANNQYSTPYGFDPSYDKQHKIKFSTDEDKESAYASALSSDYIFSGVNSSNPVDNYIAVSKHLQIDIQYASQVKLVFNKLMWRAGITLPYNLSNQLTDGANHSLTVWDYYSNLHNSYGDPVSTPDGTVHVSFRLNSDRFTNFYNDGVFKYVPYGYKDGLGIPLNKLVYYVNTGNNNQTLFSPSVPQYRRHVVIDLSTYVEGGTLLFGDPYYVGDPYSTENTGAGTLSAPYRIFTARQLKNINLFWYYNEFSCINSSGEITHFKLFENINLQGLNAKTSQRPFALTNGTITEAWLPLCYASGESTNGFDGKLDGNGKYIYGLAALGKADGNLVDTSSTSNAPLHERYDYTFGYGIFGLIKGGIIENLKIGNAYIDVTSLVSGGGASTDRCTYVGVLSAVIEDSTLSDIVFDENLEIGRYGAYRIYINAGTTTSGVGILAGSVKNSIITNITLDVYRTSAMARSNISVIGENAGTLIGSLVDNYNAVNNEGNISSRITNLEIKSTVGLAKVLINTTGTIKYSGGVIGYMEAVGAIVSNTKVNATGSVNVVMELGNSSSIYTGGIVARLRQGTLQDTQISSHAESIYQVAESNVTNVLSAEVGAVGGIAGFNSGVISNRTVTHNPNTYSPFAYTYFERGIAGTFALYGPIAGGIVGINDVEPVFYYDETNPNNNVVIISGEIVGFRLDMGSGARRLVIDAPYVMKNSAGIVSGAKGGIVGYNKQGALIDDCAFGHSNLTISGANHNYLYVYDQNANAGSEKNINELHFNHFTRQGNVGMASYLEGNLYVGGIAGATKGAIYNSYVARRDIFVKYYNAIANSPFKWNVYVGGIAGVQNLDIDDLAISSPVEYTPTKDSILLHPNAYTPLHYTMMYNWSENQGVMNDEIMKTSLAQRARVQSCFISNMQFNVGVYIWTDNNNYQAGAADEESEELTINDSNFIGERQNISVGGILGYNTFTAGAASVNNCYSYSNNFNVKVYAFGSTSTTRDQYQINVGYYHHKTWFGLSNNYYANRIGTNLAINVRGVVAGKATDYSSTATFCWTYGNTINKNNLKMTGDIESIGKNQNDMRSGDNPHYRLIGFDQSAVDADAIAYDGGVVYNMYLNMLEKNTNLFWGYYNDSDNPDSLRQRIIKTSIAGFVGWHESPDGRIFRTDPSTGILMVWHANLGEPNSINDLTWYTEALIGRAWFALDGDIYKSGSYVNAINNPQFLSSYLVDGQVKLSV
ncbi:MAG: hypothetical protein GX242_00225, partial [Clostridiales bacterium]|nr:hypothetical protein [Clostridiales bacterium]